jgi:hypothetical protein
MDDYSNSSPFSTFGNDEFTCLGMGAYGFVGGICGDASANAYVYGGVGSGGVSVQNGTVNNGTVPDYLNGLGCSAVTPAYVGGGTTFGDNPVTATVVGNPGWSCTVGAQFGEPYSEPTNPYFNESFYEW